MEQRFGPRKSVTLDVDLCRECSHLDGAEASYLGSFKIRNIGYWGLFIETGAVALPRNDLVRLTLKMDLAEGGHKEDLMAVVVHHSAEGVGVMFVEEPVLPSVLDELLTVAA